MPIFDNVPEGEIAERKAIVVERAKKMIADGKDPAEALNVALSQMQLSDIDAKSREELEYRVNQVEMDEVPEENE